VDAAFGEAEQRDMGRRGHWSDCPSMTGPEFRSTRRYPASSAPRDANVG
jgi:hypothetical protein